MTDGDIRSDRAIYDALYSPFDVDLISFRPGPKGRGGESAIALAYIDARDVMERLDNVLGPGNWSDRYHGAGEKAIVCELSVRINGEWLVKSDGAGESDIEGEKGAISGAFKRAAVKHGVGRYLYYSPNRYYPLVDGRYFSDEALHRIRNDFASWQRDYFGDHTPRQPVTPSGNVVHQGGSNRAVTINTEITDADKRNFMNALASANATRRQDGLPSVTGADLVSELSRAGLCEPGLGLSNWNQLYSLGQATLHTVIAMLRDRPCLIGADSIPF